MEPTPLARKVSLRLEPPSLADNTADLDRIRKALRTDQGLENVALDLEAARKAPAVLRDSGWEVTALLGLDSPRPRLLDLEEGHTAGREAGLALDLGTTTIVGELLDLATGRSLGMASETNPQTVLGPDILTRIQAARGQGLARLQALAAEGINRIAASLAQGAGLRNEEIVCLALAGNTTMTHLLLGLDPTNLCREPYIPVLNRPDPIPAGLLGLKTHPRAPVFVFPNVGSYFGGDLIAGLAASGLADQDEVSLLLDVGTNAEVVVGNQDWLVGCAGAAGPALEGGVARMGMPAGPGAIERVRIDPRTLEPRLSVIDARNDPPLGLCGSGLIDLVAELYLAGVIDLQGKLQPLDHPRLVMTEEGLAFSLAQEPGSTREGQLLFSQVDLDILLRSKAAMYTILVTLLSQVGLGFQDLSRIYVAGTFGRHIDPWRAMVIGMVPDLDLDRYVSLGNSSLAGARQGLVSREAREKAARIRDRITYLELNVNQEFMNRFSAAKFLPHTDHRLFPSVPRPAARPEPRIG